MNPDISSNQSEQSHFTELLPIQRDGIEEVLKEILGKEFVFGGEQLKQIVDRIMQKIEANLKVVK